ncbi:unnamed protein product, partial [Ilex paraguariensis]
PLSHALTAAHACSLFPTFGRLPSTSSFPTMPVPRRNCAFSQAPSTHLLALGVLTSVALALAPTSSLLVPASPLAPVLASLSSSQSLGNEPFESLKAQPNSASTLMQATSVSSLVALSRVAKSSA